MVVGKYKKAWQLVRSPILKHVCASLMQLIHPSQPILEKGDQLRRKSHLISAIQSYKYHIWCQIDLIYNICSVSELTCVNAT